MRISICSTESSREQAKAYHLWVHWVLRNGGVVKVTRTERTSCSLKGFSYQFSRNTSGLPFIERVIHRGVFIHGQAIVIKVSPLSLRKKISVAPWSFFLSREKVNKTIETESCVILLIAGYFWARFFARLVVYTLLSSPVLVIVYSFDKCLQKPDE